ncbi:unnamed protein product [Polarella glacialis]|uniref:site-specific DNA-methyltransferase (adenine-specific) n=1 Tax=Polarella glacialis TaxID=89957 RepID=A0A813EA87_POLGL|nr:unnamed protein product [Polarella glacialis]
MKEEACRIARLCYAKFQAGAAYADVMEYRDSLCRELTAAQPLPSSVRKRPASTAPQQKQAQIADQTTNNLKTETNQPASQQGANHQSPSMTKDSKKHRGGSSKLSRRRPQSCPTCGRPFRNQKPYDKHVAAAKCLRTQQTVATQGRLLSWLGSKFQARSLILACIPLEVQEVVSPFFGSGAAELELLRERRHVKVRASDADAALVNFWQQVLASPQAVADQLSGIIPAKRAVTAVEFDVMQRNLTRIREGAVMAGAPAVLAAARFWAVNHLCFSGLMRSSFQGPQALKLQRSREKKLQRVRGFQPPAAMRLQLAATDCFESVRTSPQGALLFLDPPYLQEGGSRRKEKLKRGGLSQARYACGPNFGLQAHTQLRQLLSTRSRWILCHSDCQEIRELYAGYHMVEYGQGCAQGRAGQGPAAAKARTGPAETVRRELLILSSWVAERAPCELLVGGGAGAEAAPQLLPTRRLRQKTSL